MTDNTKIHCPAYIEVLLWFYTRQAPLENMDAPVSQEAIEFFVDLGAIKPTSSFTYECTPLGRAWVRALESVQCPTTTFIDEHGRIISDL